MKDLKMLSVENNVLSEKEAASVRGGKDTIRSCYCACYYRNVGGSNTHDNAYANFHLGGAGGTSPQKFVRGSATIIQTDDGEIHEFGLH